MSTIHRVTVYGLMVCSGRQSRHCPITIDGLHRSRAVRHAIQYDNRRTEIKIGLSDIP